MQTTLFDSGAAERRKRLRDSVLDLVTFLVKSSWCSTLDEFGLFAENCPSESYKVLNRAQYSVSDPSVKTIYDVESSAATSWVIFAFEIWTIPGRATL